MLAAIDDAVKDGVHVLSMSIGTTEPIPYAEDGIAIGALHAVKNNIVVSCSAGNLGPAPGTLSNPAPWIITVGASSLDRAFLGPIVLGNGKKIVPDITAPGLNILAAWSRGSSPTKLWADHRIADYVIESGTSMACPHVSAVAALLRAIYPKWSSAAIRSAIMTTAWMKNNKGQSIIDPSVKRNVTNVGAAKSVYFFTAKPPKGISIKASPSILYFDKVGQKISFTLTVRARDAHTAKKYYKDDFAFGWYTWTDSYHYVRSPVAVSLA
ncbi:hypothetical protein GH714_004307 [Hevea brasiliensis]|uniref:Peptidase S8/S53 domain-containing protein n=1 Tax=Hevea brasiliensis TaxID=3981 RepID=A0A6A6LXX6_HEVBR|nr:hypothetical protein GH714_004307 [Hevea brasiliensis]